MVRTSGGSAGPGGDEPAGPGRAATPEPGAPAERHVLDDVDRRILALVARDARLSVRAIGREMRMSPGAISDRIDRMERAGVIRGYHADIDPAAIGYGTEVFVGLRTQQGPHLGDALAQLAAVPEVASIYVVTGQWDVVVRLRVRDHQHLRDLLLSQMWQVSGFLHSETLLVLESHSGPPDWFARTLSPEPPPA